MKEWVLRWGPAVAVMAGIYLASSTPGTDLPEFGIWDFVAKKGGHMVGYALLASAYLYALSRGKRLTKRQFAAALSLAFFYAITDEFHQRFTPGRSSSVNDVLIDTLGAGLGLGIWYAIKKAEIRNP